MSKKCLECWNVAVGVDEGRTQHRPTNIQVLQMAGGEYTVHFSNVENRSSMYLTNHVEDLETNFTRLKKRNYGILARHFRVRLVPGPFLARSEGSGVQTYRSPLLKLQPTSFTTCVVCLISCVLSVPALGSVSGQLVCGIV